MYILNVGISYMHVLEVISGREMNMLHVDLYLPNPF